MPTRLLDFLNANQIIVELGRELLVLGFVVWPHGSLFVATDEIQE